LALGNICNNDGRDINVYNNSATPRGDTAFNSIICNSLMGNNGLRNGSTGTNTVASSHNFFFNNAVVNASISSETNGTQNYYSQNYQAGGSLSTVGAEAFFNYTDVSSNLFIQDGGSGFALQAQGALTNSLTPIVIGLAGTNRNDQWQLVPTDSGYVRIMNLKSGLAMNVSGASLNPGAKVIQYPFGSGKNDQWMPRAAGNGLYYFVNRLSGLCLGVPITATGAQLDQEVYSGGAHQQFSLNLVGASVPQPQISSLSLSGASAVMTGSNGVANWPYLVLTSASPAAPISAWNISTTNIFDSSGYFVSTNFLDPGAGSLFYLLRLQ
jgi:hypothetical protein